MPYIGWHYIYTITYICIICVVMYIYCISMNTHILYVCLFFTIQHLVMKQNTFVSKSKGPEARRSAWFPRTFGLYNHVVEDNVSNEKNTEINTSFCIS